MRRGNNFFVGTISTIGVNQTIIAAERASGFNPELITTLNCVISIIGGVLSAIVVAYLQHKWRMQEEERRWRHEDNKNV